VRPLESWQGRRHALDGQEFLRFRGLWTRDDVPKLVEAWGCLGIGRAARGGRATGHVDWTGVLVDDPFGGEASRSELFTDWIRLSGLMDYAVGLLGLYRQPQATAHVVDAIGSAAVRRAREPEQIRGMFRDGVWVREIVGGAARMNMSCDLDDDGKFVRVASRQAGPSDARELASLLSFPLTVEGIIETLAGLVNEWLPAVHPFVAAVGNDIDATYRLPSDLLSILWLQLANRLADDRALRLCAFDRCPGPPSRPHVFFWRYGDARRQAATDSAYCHPLCARAAAAARRRAARKETAERPSEPPIPVPDIVGPEELGL
jgi:hypothetical protein